MHLAPVTNAKCKGQSGIASVWTIQGLLFTFMHPIGSDLWREISVQMGRKHSLSPIPSDLVNTLLTHINHHVTVNRHCMLPVQIKNCLCLALPSPSSSGEHTGGIDAISQALY